MAIMVAMRLRRPSDGTAAPHVLPPEHNKRSLRDLESKPLSAGSSIASRMKDASNSAILTSNSNMVLPVDAEDNDPDVIPHNTGQFNLYF